MLSLCTQCVLRTHTHAVIIGNAYSCTLTHVHTVVPHTRARLHTHARTCTYANLRTHTHECKFMHPHTQISMHTSAHMDPHAYTRNGKSRARMQTGKYTFIHLYMHAYTQTCIHMHTHEYVRYEIEMFSVMHAQREHYCYR